MTGTISSKAALALADDSGREVLRFDRVILVGRVPKGMLDGKEVAIDLVLDDAKISRVHARLSPSDSGVLVEHLGSSNGTFVNDERIDKPKLARDGDRIRFDVLEHVLSDERARAKMRQDPQTPPVDPHGRVLRSPMPGVAPPAKAPVAPIPAPDREYEGRKGGTVLGAVQNLPIFWLPPGPGTIVVGRGPVPEQRVIDVEALATEVREPTLMVFAGDSAGYPYRLKCSSEFNFWNIGKDPARHDLSIVLDDASVSDFHAKLVRRGDKWKIADQLSTNRTYVHGEIFANKFLQSKDRLRFGRVECVFLLPPVRPPLATRSLALLERLLNALTFWRRP